MKLFYLLSLAISSIIYSCKNGGEKKHPDLTETIEVIKAVILEDSLQEDFVDLEIYPVLTKYVSRAKKEQFTLGPPPGSARLFPKIEEILKSDLPEITISVEDSLFFKEQEENSSEIWLNQLNFPEYRLSKKTSPFPKAYIYFSSPIFTDTKNIAFVEVGFFCGGECGWGGYRILKKFENKWRVVKEKTYWVS
ncbi:hypothetical protein J0A68_02540 [Algoriphagus sp. H41]|uniref:Lipoprotein n=1 Tax=Algoriphagus oliviformis TaxID=2811231 RepID=A0ABS3C2J7_9BACT|nr:hypothetical protein [Algoriphagus oliviformis]MBN7809814.1 hypothetical protein [Algoriphagus oliviformis]